MAEEPITPLASGATDQPSAPQSTMRAPQPKPQTQGVTVIGPDKKTYQFPTGTTRQQAISYFQKKGIRGAPAAPKPKAPTTPTTQQPQAPQEGFFERASRLSAEAAQREMYKAVGPESRGRSLLQRNISPLMADYYAANEVAADVLGGLTKAKNLAALASGLIHPAIPASYFGGMALKDIPEATMRALHNPTPENVKQFYETVATLALSGVGADAKPSVDMTRVRQGGASVLRDAAAELNTRALKQAEPGVKGYKLSAGLQVAQDRIVGTARQLPAKIEQVRVAKEAQIARSVAQAEAQGVRVNVATVTRPILSQWAQILNQRGRLDASTIREVRGFLSQLENEVGPTGQMQPRNLSAMKPSDIIAQTGHQGILSEEAAFTKTRPDAVNSLARQIRYAYNQALSQQLPNVQRLRGEESRLIQARDAARENYAKILNDRTSVGRGIIYGSAGTIGAYLGLRALGTLPVAAIGSVVLARALAASTPSRTFRAALYARAADMLDTAQRSQQSRISGPTSAPQGGGGGLGLPGGGGGPQGPQTAAPQGFTGGLPAPQTGLPAGGAAPKPGTAGLLSAEPDIETEMRLGHPSPPETPRPKGIESKLGTPEEHARIQAAMEGRGAAKQEMEAGKPRSVAAPNIKEQARMKAMQERLSELQARRSAPKSAMDRAAIDREIAQIKKLLSGEATGAERSKILGRIRARESMARGRATAAEAPPPEAMGKTTSTGEAVSRSASPEDRMIMLEAGYQRLGAYEGGSTMVKSLKETAKAMSKLDPDYDELEKLGEALDMLRSIGMEPEPQK